MSNKATVIVTETEVTVHEVELDLQDELDTYTDASLVQLARHVAYAGGPERDFLAGHRVLHTHEDITGTVQEREGEDHG